MSIKEFLYKVCNRIGLIKSILRKRMIAHLRNNSKRINLNKKYNQMSLNEQAAYHTLYATCLDDSVIDDFIWSVTFLSENIQMPISKTNVGLEWNTALSIKGHGKYIKQFYTKLLSSDNKPSVFFDVGANYGTHSLLFLKQKVDTFSFEPNPNCHPLFNKLCALNGVQPKIINKALSDKKNTVNLYFPSNETWLGTIEINTKAKLAQNYDLTSNQIDTMTLDNFCFENNVYPDLIKIDTEGHELSVLQGSIKTLKTKNPIVLFECNQLEERIAIYSFLKNQSYDIYTLPFTEKLVSATEFTISSQTDFVAIAKDRKLKL